MDDPLERDRRDRKFNLKGRDLFAISPEHRDSFVPESPSYFDVLRKEEEASQPRIEPKKRAPSPASPQRRSR